MNSEIYYHTLVSKLREKNIVDAEIDAHLTQFYEYTVSLESIAASMRSQNRSLVGALDDIVLDMEE